MKNLYLLILLLAVQCYAQNGVRVDPFPVSTVATTALPGMSYPPILAIAGATITLCDYPANGSPCSNLATAYTDPSLGTTCPPTEPVVLNGTATCQATADNAGNFGFVVSPGLYTFMITLPGSGATFGPYIFSAGNGTTGVITFNGRNGVVVPQAGDYTCDQVTGCAPGGPVTGWNGTLASNQSSSDVTASVTVSAGTIPATGGYFRLDSEWERFTTATFVSGTSYTLSGITRARFATTAASHASGAGITAAILPFGNSSQQMFAFAGGVGGASTSFIAINCPTATSQNDTVAFEVGCGTASFTIQSSSGAFTASTSGLNYIAGSGSGLSIDTNNTGVAPYADLLNNAYALKATAQVVQTVLPTQMNKAIGFGSGISGVNSVIAPTAAAPLVQDQFVPSGSTTLTYLCQGTDYLGNNIPGTSASLINKAASAWGTGTVNIYCPLIPGAVTTTLFRTSGGPNQGILATANSGTLFFNDAYHGATAGSPNASNTTLGAVCANGNQFCQLSGASPTPSATCASGTHGWEYHDVTATTSPFAYVCDGTNWVTAY